MNSLLYGILVIRTTASMCYSFAVGKIDLAYISRSLLVGIRFTLAWLLMSLFVIHRRYPRTVADWLRSATNGLFQTAGVMGCLFVTITRPYWGIGVVVVHRLRIRAPGA